MAGLRLRKGLDKGAKRRAVGSLCRTPRRGSLRQRGEGILDGIELDDTSAAEHVWKMIVYDKYRPTKLAGGCQPHAASKLSCPNGALLKRLQGQDPRLKRNRQQCYTSFNMHISIPKLPLLN